MFPKVALIFLLSLAVVYAQQVGTRLPEHHPPLPWQKCTSRGCHTQAGGAVVIDANFRWTHATSSTTDCYYPTNGTWDVSLCPDGVTCAKNCALEGADYSGTYGITTTDNALTLKLVTTSKWRRNVGSRVYFMADNHNYEMFHLLNQELSFDVDVSQLPCGLNGALYFSEMLADGGMAGFPSNKAGAKYGTGYCDAQCPTSMNFIDGVANLIPSSNGSNSVTGATGMCCNELDLWEANSVSAAYTPHPCQLSQQTSCSGAACGGANNKYGTKCDPEGCDFNSFRMGDASFYGKGLTVDTSKPFTVVTQFLTEGNTTTGPLIEIRRIYVQNGHVIQNSKTNITGMPPYDSITDAFCNAQKTAFGNPMSFQQQGGLSQMGAAMARGMVLVMSLWDDSGAHMLWLDSDFPSNASVSQPGVVRGTCATTSGVPADIESQFPNAKIVFSNIKVGDIGSTIRSRPW
ncbi:cellulase [Tricholoma matsutake]|nr:cellulase [Tricholoma matsutake 945]